MPTDGYFFTIVTLLFVHKLPVLSHNEGFEFRILLLNLPNSASVIASIVVEVDRSKDTL